MMKRVKMLGMALSAMLVLAACGNDEKTSTDEKKPKEEATQKTTEEQKPEPNPAVEKEDSSDAKQATELLNPNLEKETGGKVEVLYSNNDAKFVKDFDGFKVSVDAYQLVKVTDMDQDVAMRFDNQTDGYVLTSKVTITNGTNEPKYYNNTHNIRMTDKYTYIPSNTRSFLADKDIIASKTEKEIGKFAANETVTGLLTFNISNEEFATMQTVKPKYVIEGGVAKDTTFKGATLGEGIFDFVYNDEQKQAIAADAKFYQDQLTTGNLADKKMIFEKSGINDTKQLGEASITLDGVQYTEITPTETNKDRFRNFGDSGIVALTMKFNIDNKSQSPISLSSLISILKIDDNRARVMSEGMVEPREPDVIEPGAKGEKYHVFLMRKDEFGIYKKFKLEFGPLVDSNGQRLFKSKQVLFSVPR
ncbi:DUF5068 domain-containing protein [Bacillus massiliigorillae]|uniref:DUF5068 domain-containing protein n=1 Tax=Bacillus massiliigorillae TaxID=1243664 RepID=UPI0003AA2E9A|nr:DUF5068 domain-containing protein [Bacillus massiliigorillae]